MKLSHATLIAILSLGVGLAGCEKKPETTAEKIEDKVKDGLDMRPHEKAQDAAEDASKALKEAGEAAKEAVTPDSKK